jgi:hypothetical protein
MYAHGTHVAGIAIRGNPAAKLVVFRFNDQLPKLTFAPTAESAHRMADNFREIGEYCRRHHVRVVNMSWEDDPTCEECTGKSSMTFAVTSNGTARDMHSIVRDDIYRIAYEAIRNASTHSKGSKLDIELTYGRDFVLLVRDDGIGFATDLLVKAKDRHFGLLGMQERSKRIGAKLSFHSRKPGTDVELLVPGRIAYGEKNGLWRRLVGIRRA